MAGWRLYALVLALGLALRMPSTHAQPECTLYAGGSFYTVGGTPASSIARWDGTAWSTLGGGIGGVVEKRRVLAIAEYNSDVFVGGEFLDAGGEAVGGLAKWDGAAWSAVTPGLATTRVWALHVYAGSLYMGGRFTPGGGGPGTNIAAWDGSTWSNLGGGTNPTGAVRALATHNGDLYAGGQFTEMGGTALYNIARWDGTAWAAVGQGMSNNDAGTAGVVDNTVLALASFGGDLYVGGNLNEATTPSPGLSRWDGTAWSAVGAGLDGVVFALAPYAGALYAGGSFVEGIASWDGTAWHGVGGGIGLRPIVSKLPAVLALGVFNGELHAGGTFDIVGTGAGAKSVHNLAAWDGATWREVAGGVSHEVAALAAVGGTSLYVGGDFRGVNLAAGVSNIAAWSMDSATWSSVGGGVTSSSSPHLTFVYAAAVYDQRLYVGGSFNRAGAGTVAANVASWDGNTWAPAGTGTDNTVYALEPYCGYLIAGGQFQSAGGVSASTLARWDGSTWTAVAMALASPSTSLVASLAVHDGHLFVGGFFQLSTSTGPAYNIARWNGTRWYATPAPAGVQEVIVMRLASYTNGILASLAIYDTDGFHVAHYDGTSWELLTPLDDNLPTWLTATAAPLASQFYSVLYNQNTMTSHVAQVFGGMLLQAHIITPAASSAASARYMDCSTCPAWTDLPSGAVFPVPAPVMTHNSRIYFGTVVGSVAGFALEGIPSWDGASSWTSIPVVWDRWSSQFGVFRMHCDDDGGGVADPDAMCPIETDPGVVVDPAGPCPEFHYVGTDGVCTACACTLPHCLTGPRGEPCTTDTYETLSTTVAIALGAATLVAVAVSAGLEVARSTSSAASRTDSTSVSASGRVESMTTTSTASQANPVLADALGNLCDVLVSAVSKSLYIIWLVGVYQLVGDQQAALLWTALAVVLLAVAANAVIVARTWHWIRAHHDDVQRSAKRWRRWAASILSMPLSVLAIAASASLALLIIDIPPYSKRPRRLRLAVNVLSGVLSLMRGGVNAWSYVVLGSILELSNILSIGGAVLSAAYSFFKVWLRRRLELRSRRRCTDQPVRWQSIAYTGRHTVRGSRPTTWPKSSTIPTARTAPATLAAAVTAAAIVWSSARARGGRPSGRTRSMDENF